MQDNMNFADLISTIKGSFNQQEEAKNSDDDYEDDDGSDEEAADDSKYELPGGES